MSNLNFRFKPALFSLLAALLICASAAQARDMSEYGYYLGARLKMYAESEALLTKIMRDGNKQEQANARSALARVLKNKADDEFSKTADEDARNRGYEKAEQVYGDPDEKDVLGHLELASLRLEIGRARARTNPEGARHLIEKAMTTLGSLVSLDSRNQNGRLDKLLNEMGEDKFFASNEGTYFKRAFYEECVGYFVKGLTFPERSPERESCFKAAEDWISELEFRISFICYEKIDALLLKGDIQLAARNVETAVSRYLDVAGYVQEEGGNGAEAGFHALRGWLKAAELMTTELGYDKKYLQMCVDHYQKAYTKYGSIKDLATEFKRFNLYKISAKIKMGGEIGPTLEELFTLANDSDVGFKRQALSVLGDISMFPELDNELRLKCSRAVIKDAYIVGYGPILKVCRAYQILLAKCGTQQEFEQYAPECYSKLGVIYKDLLQRYMDAAMLYREATLRCWYFRTKFGGKDEELPAPGGELPAHMKGKCEFIVDTKTGYEFVGEMAKAYANVANWLLSPKYGEPGNKEFIKIQEEAETLKAKSGDEDAVHDLAFKKGSELYNDKNKKLSQAAVRYASLPAKYKKFRLALYYAASAYAYQIEDKNARHPNRAGPPEEQETDEWFKSQRARHATDLAALPKELWEHQEEAHFDAMANNRLSTETAMWHKAAYFFKKYMMVILLKNWDELKDKVDVKKDDFVACFMAYCELQADKWKAQPEKSRTPQAEMEMMGRAAYWYAFLMRNPAKTDPNAASIRNANRATALRILKRHWEVFGPHFADPANPAAADEVKKAVLELSFGCLEEELDGDGCEALLRAYEAAYGGSKDEKIKKKIANFIGDVFRIYKKTLDPQVQAYSAASTNLRSLFNQLKLGLFVNENAFGSKAPDKVDKYNKSKSELEKNRMLAQHFWDEWVVKNAFGNDKAVETLVAPEILPHVKKKWDEYAALYPKRWGDAVRTEIDAQLKEKVFDSIRSDIQKLLSGVPNTDLVDKLREAKNDSKTAADKADLINTLLVQVSLNTDHMRYFIGTTFVYDFGSFLEETSAGLDERMRPMLTKVLTYYERWQEVKADKETVSKETNFQLGKLFFRVRDYKRAAGYLQDALDLCNKESYFGNETVIPVNVGTFTAGQAAEGMGGPSSTRSGDELELKFQLGRCYLELYKQDRDVEKLKKAALNMRRAYCFILLRNANEMGKKQRKEFTLTFQREIELYYLDCIDATIEIYMELHKQGAPKVDYPQYVDQFNLNLDPDNKDREGKANRKYQDLPKTEADYLAMARRIHQDNWTSFSQLEDHPYRPEYKKSYVAWIEMMTAWVAKYNFEGKEVFKGKDAVRAAVDEAVQSANGKCVPNIGYEDEGTKKFKSDIKAARDRLIAAAKKADPNYKEPK